MSSSYKSFVVKEAIAWATGCHVNPAGHKLTKVEERVWGNRMIGQVDNSQWTTLVGEHVVFKVLQELGKNPTIPVKKGGYKPDIETDDHIYEVKTRNWNTTGTIGEKVFGCPLKYAEIPELYGKPLRIICVAYQEEEFVYGKTPIFGTNVRDKHKKFMSFYRDNGIEFYRFSDFVEELEHRKLSDQ